MYNRRLEISYAVSYELLGLTKRQGYATEAVSALLKHCFETLNVNRIEALIDPTNEASKNLALNLSFKQEGGPMRKRTLMPDGKFADRLMFGLLQCKWRKSQVPP